MSRSFTSFSGVSPGLSSHRAHSLAGSASTYKISSSSFGMAGSGFGAGGAGASASAFGAGFGGGFGVQEASSFGASGKETMRNLNDRLAVYLDKVRSLEKANGELELKIREFYEKRTSFSTVDQSGYYDIINKLRSQIQDATTQNARLILQIDNAKLAADDFKIKYESELAIRHGVESDITGLRRALDELTINRSDLEHEIEGLKEELIFLKKNHEEEMALIQGQVGGKVNVEVDSAPAVDLSKILAEVRQQYETLVEKNRQEVETWYRTQSESLNKEVAVYQESFQTSKSESMELKRKYQTLELELQALINTKLALENSLAETEGRYGAELGKLQGVISQIEADLQRVRSDSETHSLEYRTLLDIKTRLEQEIATYRRLLDGEGDSFALAHALDKGVTIVSKEDAQSTSTKTIKVKTVVEEVVDGKVVSSSVREVTQ
ncbi:keratin, type I cytoskeletal 47 kDa-like [Hyperolius riggenbachi]|uniref:keratin, type I cytoskeletal 47 kDa-like n=1 Tax=Hyperolius riggenbachi TaxID=752182 RepID=UPI0035A3AE96